MKNFVFLEKKKNKIIDTDTTPKYRVNRQSRANSKNVTHSRRSKVSVFSSVLCTAPCSRPLKSRFSRWTFLRLQPCRKFDDTIWVFDVASWKKCPTRFAHLSTFVVDAHDTTTGTYATQRQTVNNNIIIRRRTIATTLRLPLSACPPTKAALQSLSITSNTTTAVKHNICVHNRDGNVVITRRPCLIIVSSRLFEWNIQIQSVVVVGSVFEIRIDERRCQYSCRGVVVNCHSPSSRCLESAGTRVAFVMFSLDPRGPGIWSSFRTCFSSFSHTSSVTCILRSDGKTEMKQITGSDDDDDAWWLIEWYVFDYRTGVARWQTTRG